MIDFTLTENDQARLDRTYAEGRWVRQFVRAADENDLKSLFQQSMSIW